MSVSAAIKAGDVTLLPGKRDEDWRWTDLRGLIRQAPAPSPPGEAWAWQSPLAQGAFEIVDIVNGSGATPISVAAGQSRAVALRFLSTETAGSHAAQVTVRLAEGARLILVESYEGRGVGYLAHAAIEIELAEGAALERVVFAADDAEGVAVSQANVVLHPRSDFAQTVLTTGGRRQRIETRVAHPGAGARVRMDGAYLLDGKRHADLTTVVEHLGVDGTTTQLVKGVVRDQARGVFQGRILVAQGADRTDARMGHHALILSDRAEVDAKPELLIFADDVQCAHGNTIGALDEDALFYAMQRGMPHEVARAMLIEAFVGQAVDRIVHDDVRAAAQGWAAQHLGRA